jgi:hypothetical protein
MSIQNEYILDKWRRTGEMLKRRIKFSAKKPISEMNLEECRDAEKRYIDWLNKHGYNNDSRPKNPQHATAIHVYNTYLMPRLQDLAFLENTENILINEKSDITGTQHELVS